MGSAIFSYSANPAMGSNPIAWNYPTSSRLSVRFDSGISVITEKE